MALREDINRKIERKQAEIREYELKTREAQAYIQALQETLKMLPREHSEHMADRSLRAGSSVSKAREAIAKAGKPLYIADILKALGRPDNKKNRLSLSGSLGHYVRKREFFTRPDLNTFGIVEFQETNNDESDDPGETHPLSNGRS
jgi:hypothetical protein